jgi:hypothetical protein
MSDPGWSNDWWGRDPIELDETEFDCDACTRVHFREDGDDFEDSECKPYRVCRRCQHLDVPQHFGLTPKGMKQ